MTKVRHSNGSFCSPHEQLCREGTFKTQGTAVTQDIFLASNSKLKPLSLRKGNQLATVETQ